MAAEAVVFPIDRWYEIDAEVDLRAAELIFTEPPPLARGSRTGDPDDRPAR